MFSIEAHSTLHCKGVVVPALNSGTKAMPWVVRYVEKQREHHAQRTTCERLERVEIDKSKPVETGSL
jgi:hypothetical protein